MTGTAPARIFISYSRKDGAASAAELRDDLRAEHLSVWQDIIALEGGRDWWTQIEQALRSKTLQHFALVVTPAALASKVIRDEIRLARQEGKTVSPVKGPGLDLNNMPRWLGQVYDLEIPEHRDTLMRVLRLPSRQTRVPMMAPEPPAVFVARPRESGALKARLLDRNGNAVAITAALRGAGGYGKTTLAKALAHDADIQDAYYDGVLWAELGERPANLLSMLADLAEILTGERPGVETINGAAAKLGEALGERRILLVIDDVWREQDLRPFLQGGRNTTRLITTRIDTLLPMDAARQPVNAMQPDEALELLVAGLPDRAAEHQAKLAQLAARLGNWALLLKLVNGFLRHRVIEGREPLGEALTSVNKRLDAKGLTAFDARDEIERSKAVARTIGVSMDLLDQSGRDRFCELGVFPEDANIPIGIVASLWQESGGLDELEVEDLLSTLTNLSLLLVLDLEQKTVRMHDTVRRFLRERAGKEGLAIQRKRLRAAFDGLCTSAVTHSYPNLSYNRSNIEKFYKKIGFDILDVSTEFSIEPDGTAAVIREYLLKSNTDDMFMFETWIAGDQETDPIDKFSSLHIIAYDKKTSERLPCWVIVDEPRRKQFLILFEPIQVGEQKEITMKYKWPGYFKQLTTLGNTEFFWNYGSSEGSVIHVRYHWLFKVGFPRVEVILIGNHDSSAMLSSFDDSEGLHWVYEANSLSPGRHTVKINQTGTLEEAIRNQ